MAHILAELTLAVLKKYKQYISIKKNPTHVAYNHVKPWEVNKYITQANLTFRPYSVIQVQTYSHFSRFSL